MACRMTSADSPVAPEAAILRPAARAGFREEEFAVDRRRFLKQAVGLSAVQGLRGAAQTVSIVVDPRDPIASSGPCSWAVREVQAALDAHGIASKVYPRVEAAPPADHHIVVAGANRADVRQILRAAEVELPSVAEALCLSEGTLNRRPVLLAAGSDTRGIVYALLELADRVRCSTAGVAALHVPSPIVEKPANAIRSCARCFVTPIEDKAWFYDREMWREYLSELAAHRFNRFNLTFGIGYNSARNIPDSYFYLAYPFLFAVPGYHVTAAGLPDAERAGNLETVRFISEETVARGIQFNMALWSHAYEWPNPDTNYRITGLTPETHAPYCRDALALLLKTCPNITGVSIRMHGESGIPDGRYDFWETLFDAFKTAGRRIDIDLHAKGTDERHIGIALATGNSVSMAPKFWAEHMGMPYHQAAIREEEMRGRGPNEPRNAATTRRFLRYGYGDYLKDDRKFGMIHRIWPGTQRHLLWADPAMGAGYGRAFGFSGSLGVEIFEPLSFKGRMGSGMPGGRNAYLDKSLDPKHDWEKFRYQYRLWGRLLYNPDTDPEVWRRYLRHEFQNAAEPVEASLGHASRVLPVITTAHGASGSNNSYWPEMYMNMPVVDPNRARPYSDTPDPKVFGTVSAFDPQLFSSAEECADALAHGQSLAKYTSLDVAQWLDDASTEAVRQQQMAIARAAEKNAPEFRRVMADVEIQAGIGRFFAYKMRSAVLWSLYRRTGDRRALEEAVKAYRTARQAWAGMAGKAKAVYSPDITYGLNANMRGHWIDRLAGIDADLADMENALNETAPIAKSIDAAAAERAIATVLARPRRLVMNGQHTPPARFDPGKPLELSVSFGPGNGRVVRLLYRHADQSQRWRAQEMQVRDAQYRGVIQADYTDSPYPLLYYFEVEEGGVSGIYPGFDADLSNQPYYLVRGNRPRG
jgi:hypothetical protein